MLLITTLEVTAHSCCWVHSSGKISSKNFPIMSQPNYETKTGLLRGKSIRVASHIFTISHLQIHTFWFLWRNPPSPIYWIEHQSGTDSQASCFNDDTSYCTVLFNVKYSSKFFSIRILTAMKESGTFHIGFSSCLSPWNFKKLKTVSCFMNSKVNVNGGCFF